MANHTPIPTNDSPVIEIRSGRTGVATEILLDGQPLQGVREIEFKVVAGGLSEVKVTLLPIQLHLHGEVAGVSLQDSGTADTAFQRLETWANGHDNAPVGLRSGTGEALSPATPVAITQNVPDPE